MCKVRLEEILNESRNDPEGLKRKLDLYRFEIREFKNRYFPKENEQVLFNRIEFVKTQLLKINEETTLKKKFSVFLLSNINSWKC